MPPRCRGWHSVDDRGHLSIGVESPSFPVGYDPEFQPGLLVIDPEEGTSLCVTAGMQGERERSIVEILELQPAGKRRMSAAEFLRGRRPLPGDRFGPESTDESPA